jgi:hypothetical protein
VVTLAEINAFEAMVAPMMVSGGVSGLESGGQFRAVAFGRNLASVAVKIFSRLN